MNEIIIERFRNMIKENLVPLINDDYALLDIPNHCNIGDNLIWEGEINFLNKYIPYKCKYTANVFNWDEDKIVDINMILLHGGGNWGDLYRVSQDLRLYLAKKYKNKRILVFPQTVWYNNTELLKNDCEIFNNHPDIFICLRDKLSYDILSRNVSVEKLLLLPDMAFFVEIPLSLRKGNKKLYMQRTDPEVGEKRLIFPFDIEVKDWPTYSNNRIVYFIKNWIDYKSSFISVRLQKCKLTSWMVSPVYGLNRRNNRERYVKMAFRFFEKYDVIYTTRLHGLILGVLMEKVVHIVDNKYNKCKNFYDTWLKECNNISIELQK